MPTQDFFHYSIYGLWLKSNHRFSSLKTALKKNSNLVADLELHVEQGVHPDRFADQLRALGVNVDHWFYSKRLESGEWLVCWKGLFSFSIDSKKRLVRAFPATRAYDESLEFYFFAHVISFFLVEVGIEVTHATVVERDGKALGFLAPPGYGKSTLAAACVAQGYQIVTDDLLVLNDTSEGYRAFRGAGRIKLFPEVKAAVLPQAKTLSVMHPATSKSIIEVSQKSVGEASAPLSAFYFLPEPTERSHLKKKIQIKPASRKTAFFGLLVNSFNTIVKSPARSAQQFQFANRLIDRVPIFELSYPRKIELLQEVVHALSR